MLVMIKMMMMTTAISRKHNLVDFMCLLYFVRYKLALYYLRHFVALVDALLLIIIGMQFSASPNKEDIFVLQSFFDTILCYC